VPLRLRSEHQLWRLAADLGLRGVKDPVARIRAYCRETLRKCWRQYGCQTLDELLATATACLDTLFIEIHSDEDVERVKCEYLRKGEPGFADLEFQLSFTVYAITIHRRAVVPGERAFVSIIDCRGDKRWRAYFSKWHEIAHLLTLTDQARLKFCRTHAEQTKEPEEALMDLIAGDCGFLPELLRPHTKGPITFAKLDALRREHCPTASEQASLIGLVRAWPTPALLVRAAPNLRKKELRAAAQGGFDFHKVPEPALRAIHVMTNEAAVEQGLHIPRNMRVPETSIISQVFHGNAGHGAEQEDLAWWTTSDGKQLTSRSVEVEVRRRRDYVEALITPV
jgi:hypothetical protein